MARFPDESAVARSKSHFAKNAIRVSIYCSFFGNRIILCRLSGLSTNGGIS